MKKTKNELLNAKSTEYEFHRKLGIVEVAIKRLQNEIDYFKHHNDELYKKKKIEGFEKELNEQKNVKRELEYQILKIEMEHLKSLSVRNHKMDNRLKELEKKLKEY